MDVGTRLDGYIERPVISILNLCIRGAGDARYPDIPRQFSVRTEGLSAGLLRVGDDRWAFKGAYGKSAPPDVQRILARIELVAGGASGTRCPSTI